MNNKLQKSISLICLGWAFTVLNGCASISSEVVYKDSENSLKGIEDGIVYYMPKRNIRLNVVVANPGSGAGSSTSDTSKSRTVPTSVIPTVVGNSKTNIKTEIDSNTYPVGKFGKVDDKAPTKLDNKTVTVSLANNYDTETIPDYSKQFLLDYRRNLFGANNMAIGINSYGLLSVSHADTVNKFDQIASNIAIDIASASLGAGPAPQTACSASPLSTYDNITPGSYKPPSDSSVNFTMSTNKVTCPNGNYTYSYDPSKPPTEDESKICGVQIIISSAFTKPILMRNTIRLAQKKPDPLDMVRSLWPSPLHRWGKPYKSLSGLFYRQDLPYIVTVKEAKAEPTSALVSHNSQFLALSPNESMTYFAPITKTLFTNNTSDITMANGVVTSLKENTDSELFTLSKIPADVLGAYTNAVGQIFQAIGTEKSSQNTNQTTEFTLMQTSAKIGQCQAMIATNPIAGLTGDALTLALSNIRTGCGN